MTEGERERRQVAAVSEIAAAGAANDLFKRCSLREGERKDKRREKEGSILGLDEQRGSSVCKCKAGSGEWKHGTEAAVLLFGRQAIILGILKNVSYKLIILNTSALLIKLQIPC